MRKIWGRFIDCLILWALSVFYSGDNKNFWMALSANMAEGEYCFRTSVSLFTDDYLSDVWGLYVQKAWLEFKEDVLANYNKGDVKDD